MDARATKNASVEKITGGWRLGIDAGGASSYRDAQLDDYAGLRRMQFPHCPPERPSGQREPGRRISLSLSARISTLSAAGTWGFGLWNDPFGLSLGFGGNPFRLPALPNAAWFFYASPQNYLSFKSGQSQRIVPTNGFMAQTFRSPKFHPLLIPAGLALPFSRVATRNLLGRVIAEDSSALSVDTTQWHRYRLEWGAERVAWDVDEVRVFESPVSPNPPLGVIIWIDNQYAAFTPEGKISAGVLGGESEWLDVEEIVMSEK